MRFLAPFCIAFVCLLGSGCNRVGSTGEGGAPAPSSAPVVGTPAASATVKSPWLDHAHDSVHGGRVHTAGDGHLEVKLSPAGHMTVWLMDASRHPLSASGATGAVRVGSRPETALSYDAKDGALHADASGTAPGTTAVVEVRVKRADASTMEAKFNISPTE